MSDSRKISHRVENSNGLLRTDYVIALATVSKGLRRLRKLYGYVHAIQVLAPFVGMKPRQLRGWVYSEVGYAGPRERNRIRIGVANALRWCADELEREADRARREADEVECHERQLTLWRDAICSQPYERRVA
jgi:hypothetical protein